MWFIDEVHKIYGKVTAMMLIEGEPYRFFEDKHGTISMIPLSTLKKD